jgi:hypothetical protein
VKASASGSILLKLTFITHVQRLRGYRDRGGDGAREEEASRESVIDRPYIDHKTRTLASMTEVRI